MPEYVYIGEEPRTYPGLGLEAVPGQTYSLSDIPDHRFIPAEPKSPKSAKNEQE